MRITFFGNDINYCCSLFTELFTRVYMIDTEAVSSIYICIPYILHVIFLDGKATAKTANF